MNISYQKLTPAHAALYRHIRLLSLQMHPEAYGSTYEEESAKEKLFFEHCIEKETSSNFVIGAFDGDKLIGISGFFKNDHIKTAHRGDIIQVFVLPGYRRKNIGAEMLNATITEARRITGLEQIELGVATTNPAAIQCYRKNGFEQTGVMKRALKIDNQYIDEYLMVLFL